MSKKKKKKRSHRYHSPLASHKRDRKKLVAPMNALPNLRSVNWVADLLPEVLWAAAMLHEYQHPEPAWLVLDALDEVTPEEIFLDGHLSTFSLIPDDRRLDALELLSDASVPPLPDGLGHAMSLYPQCPAAWLCDDWSRANTPDIERGVSFLKSIVREHFDSRSVPATRVRLIPIGRLVRAGRIHVPPDFVDTSYIPRYPGGLTEDERRGAESEIRAMYGALHAAALDTASQDWARYFWRQNYRISVCELPSGSSEAPGSGSLGDAARPTATQVLGMLVDASDELSKELVAAQRKIEVDLYSPEADEVKLGLASRQTRLLRLILTDPYLWAGSAGSHVLRALVDTMIVTLWLLVRDDPVLFDRFRAYGLGKLKLFKLHLEDYLDGRDEDPSPEQAAFLESLEDEVSSEILESFIDIDLGGSFAGVDIRRMAEEADLKPYYDLAYQPYSSDAHGDWVSVKRADLQHCTNPLHRFHRVARFGQRDEAFHPEVMEVAIDFAERTVSSVFASYGIDVEDAFDRFRKRVFRLAEDATDVDTADAASGGVGVETR